MYIAKVDPTSSLGLSTESIYSYSMGHIKRVLGGESPETQPSRCMSRGPSSITVALKGLWRNVVCESYTEQDTQAKRWTKERHKHTREIDTRVKGEHTKSERLQS